MIAEIDKTRDSVKEDVQQTMHDVVVQQIKTDRFISTLEIMENLQESNFKMLNRFFTFYFKADLTDLEMANEAAKEFHISKFNQIGYAFKPKQKK